VNTLEFTIHVLKFDALSFFDDHGADAKVIFPVLLAGEDHRGARHRGIDWISIVRAAALSLRIGRVRGLSTIEQQYVRTVHQRRGNLILSKLRELYISRLLWRRATKEEIWAAYLWRAYYGARMNWYSAARDFFIARDQPLDVETAAKIVACLKFPRSIRNADSWAIKHSRRVQYILRRLERQRTD
jgi:membrane peptidoglycan carboxypeptidase